ncbi:MAG TPA: SRPBCC family protein [Kribbella sp.]
MTETSVSSGTLVFQIYIRSTPEQVWEAITSPQFRAKYFYGSTVESDYKVGSRMRSRGPNGELWGDNLILESDPPRLLSHEWRSLYDPELAAEPISRVTWTVEPAEAYGEGVTSLTVVHDKLDDSPKTAASVSGGWMFIISGLKTVVETGSPLAGE